MNSPKSKNEEPSSTVDSWESTVTSGLGGSESAEALRPPAKRRFGSPGVIEISDTESDDSDVCAVNSYQASADEVKRIRGDYSSSSSSSEYSSDSESSWEDDSIVIPDSKANTQPNKAQLNPRANRTDDPKMNDNLKSEDVIDRLSENWKALQDWSSSEVTLTCRPFRLCLLHNFLKNPEIINNIVDDMNTLDWSRKKMDLYEFHQTADLASLTWQRSIRGIYELLKNEVMPWVAKVTGLELRSVSASCSLYGPGDHLLVHDDLLTDRRVAFILYLAPWVAPVLPHALNGASDELQIIQVEGEELEGWSRHMGGALELLATDADGSPTEVEHSVFPRNNMLAFFKVGTDSFHQVSEVVSVELPRLSINGWFHGPEPTEGSSGRPPRRAEALPAAMKPLAEPVVLAQWVETAYMSPRTRLQIQAQMEHASEVCLHALLPAARRAELEGALRQEDLPWERRGPADRRRHWALPASWLEAQPREHPLHALLHLAASAAFVRLLSDCTGLALARVRGAELQRWGPGDYTLLPPPEEYAQARLEAVLHLAVTEPPPCGGATVFVAPEDPDAVPGGALVTLPPADNALALVYCEAGTACFTRRLPRLPRPPPERRAAFFRLVCTYLE